MKGIKKLIRNSPNITGFKRKCKCSTKSPIYLILWHIKHIRVETRTTTLDMITAIHARLMENNTTSEKRNFIEIMKAPFFLETIETM